MSGQEGALQHQEKKVEVSDLPRTKDGRRKALIIGISKYDHNNKFRDLDFCENDAKEVYRILKDQGYDIPENAKLIGRVEWSKMRDEIVDFFTDGTLKPDDTLIFYFSGHGYLDKNTGRTYLATSEINPQRPESRGFRFDELTYYLNGSNSERIVAALDCCYSGALEVGGKGEGGGEDEVVSSKSEAAKGEEIADSANANMKKTVDRIIRSGQGKCVLASSLEEQKSFKMQDQPYSLFTYFLIEGLRGANGQSVDDNGYVTPTLLGSYVNKKMYELPTIKQKPIRRIEETGQIVLAHYPNLAKRQQQQTSQRDSLLQLLTGGKIDKFNEIRRRDNYSRMDFYKVDLSGRDLCHADLRNADFVSANLSGANLSDAVLSKSDLRNADFVSANLSGANLSKSILINANLSKSILRSINLSDAVLSGANLSDAVLSGANLSFSDLTNVNFSGANLSGANLSSSKSLYSSFLCANLSGANLSKSSFLRADLSNTDLSNTDLSNTDLEYSIIIGVKFDDRTERHDLCNGATFKNAIIDDEEFRRHLSIIHAGNVPRAIRDKKELRRKLKERGFDAQTIDRYLSFSSLPDSST